MTGEFPAQRPATWKMSPFDEIFMIHSPVYGKNLYYEYVNIYSYMLSRVYIRIFIGVNGYAEY